LKLCFDDFYCVVGRPGQNDERKAVQKDLVEEIRTSFLYSLAECFPKPLHANHVPTRLHRVSFLRLRIWSFPGQEIVTLKDEKGC